MLLPKTSTIVLLFLMSLAISETHSTAQTPVRAAAAQVQTLQQRHAVTGSLRAVARGSVAALESGRIVEVTVREGANVSKGEMLARVDARRLEAELRQAKADKRVAQADLESHLATVEQTSANYTRVRSLVETNVVSKEEYDEALANLRVARANVEATRRRIEAVEERIGHLEIRLSDTEIHAPYDATIVQRHVEPGAWVQPGDPLLTIVSTGPIEAWLEVPERYVESISRYGDAVTVRSRATGEVAHILSTRRVADVNRRVRTMSFVVTLSNESGLLTPGMSVDGWIAVTGELQATTVSKDAVIQGSGSPYVYRVKESGERRVAERIPVRIQFETEHFVAVQSVSLKPGDLVIEEGNERLMDGQAIAVTIDSRPGTSQVAQR